MFQAGLKFFNIEPADYNRGLQPEQAISQISLQVEELGKLNIRLPGFSPEEYYYWTRDRTNGLFAMLSQR